MGMTLLSTFYMAVLPVTKLLLTCSFGAWLGSKYMQVLTTESRKQMNMMVFLAYTPALVFCKLTNAVSIDNLIAWWYMPLNVIMSYMIGSGLAFVVISHTNPPPHLKSLVIACCAAGKGLQSVVKAGFVCMRGPELKDWVLRGITYCISVQQLAGNIGNVPLVLVPSICSQKDNPFGTSETCSQNGIAYVSFGMWMGMVLTWSFIYNILKPDVEESIQLEKGGNAISSADSSSVVSPHSSDFGEFQSGHYAIEYPNVGLSNEFVQNNWNASSSTFVKPQSPPLVFEEDLPTQKAPPKLTSDRSGYFRHIAEKYDIKRILTPPTAAALAGLTVGLVPSLKSLFLGPLRAFTESAEIIGAAMIPCMNLVLGASLVQGTQTCELPKCTIIGIILVRLFILPIVGMMTIKIAHDLGFLPEDPLFRFVLMLQYTMPTAMNVGTVAQLHGVGEREVALVLFYSYMSASVFLTFWMLIYLRYTFDPSSFI